MMYLETEFPNDFRTTDLLESNLVPCICRISDKFKIEFSPPIFDESIFGEIKGWDQEKLDERVMAWVGGQYFSINHAQISVEKIKDSTYRVMDLLFFTPGFEFGWHPVIASGDYGPVLSAYDDDGIT